MRARLVRAILAAAFALPAGVGAQTVSITESEALARLSAQSPPSRKPYTVSPRKERLSQPERSPAPKLATGTSPDFAEAVKSPT